MGNQHMTHDMNSKIIDEQAITDTTMSAIKMMNEAHTVSSCTMEQVERLHKLIGDCGEQPDGSPD
jgi:hypothetical protein